MIAALALASCVHAATMTESVLIAGFESEAEVARMEVRDSTRLELVTNGVKDGARAAMVTFEAVVEGRQQWPAIVMRRDALPTTDFTGYGAIEFWARSVGDGDAMLRLVIYDDGGGSGYPMPSSVELKQHEWTRVVAELPASGADLSSVESLHFYQDRNAEEYRVILDAVRLMPRFSVEAGHLRQSLDRARESARRERVIDQMADDLTTLEAEADDLLAAAAQTELGSERAGEIEGEAVELRRKADALSLKIAKERAAKRAGASGEDFVLVAESSMVNVMPDAAPFSGRPGKPVAFAVAGGETEAGQIIVAPLTRTLRGVEFSASPLSGPRGQTLAAELSAMGYVYTNPDVPPSYPVDRLGWFPDPILPFVDRFDVDADKIQSLWLSVTCPAGQTPGLYRGVVTVTPDNADAQTIPVRVRVFDFDVPKERSLKTAICTFESHFPRIYGEDWKDTVLWKYVDFLHAHRMNYDRIYRGHEDPPALEDVERLIEGGQDAWCLRYIVQPG